MYSLSLYLKQPHVQNFDKQSVQYLRKIYDQYLHTSAIEKYQKVYENLDVT